MAAQTYVSFHRYVCGAVLATVKKRFSTDGYGPRSTTTFYNKFGADSVYEYRRYGFQDVRPSLSGVRC